MSKEAMKLALEALEAERDNYQDWDEKDGAPEYIYEAITALREALAEQPAQPQPVTTTCRDSFLAGYETAQADAKVCDLPPHGWHCTRNAGHEGPCAAVETDDRELVAHAMKRLAEQPAQPQQEPAQQQEPVAIVAVDGIGQIQIGWIKKPQHNDKLYASPPASKPLTDELAVLRLVSEEYNAWIHAHAGGGSYDEFLKQRLAAHGIKENT